MLLQRLHYSQIELQKIQKRQKILKNHKIYNCKSCNIDANKIINLWNETNERLPKLQRIEQ